ncbi:fibronectin type III domain-containing protein [Paenibacillus mucilaginosus]|uniref:chitinase n=2 Tax=Paenibacillus mucilaginosus TaxID=61624 RepID=H6N8T0_9BACL|nr:glycosyl hydrolase family 18 protein [Paenibacillus mucilaginosus]AEI38889.1 Fibronectin type III domain protein [Paenibacillus mucilaginosus KNP414]AFC27204.1 Fibronectin type III domain-containing protein [Paenibacillus mucilaginosus 3016]MCG7217290.1 glycosyl hydrolase family 18 protein [Paenibacillus mucilaginosus]WDM27950.1 fibronectin type III domain-containing protein [Paenibacillus mucilaginosus]WFA16126.1 carbohydrate-binding protein [Paenibacillus mucilaginosus]
MMYRAIQARRSTGFRTLTFLLIAALLLSLTPLTGLAADRGAWAPGVAYQTNDTASYSGKIYTVLQSHTSQIGWEPPNVPALWKETAGGGTGSDTQAPAAPAGLRVNGTTSSSVSLSWTAATDNVAVTGYDIYRGSVLAGSVSGSTLSFTNTGLAAGTYSFTVKAKDAAGNVSAASGAVSATVSGSGGSDTQAPSVPAGLKVTGTTSSSVSLSWTASTDNTGVTGYDVYRGTILAASVSGTTAIVTGLAASTSYTFTVKAKDAAGNVSAASSSISATTAASAGGTLPKRLLTGYWHNFINNSANLKLSQVPAAYDIIAVSFGEMDLANPGGVTFTVDPSLSSALGGYTDADLIHDIKAKQAQGKKVILSLGGEKGNVNLSSASPNVSNFVNSVSGLITKFGFDGIDIDLEHGFNVANLTSGVRQIQQKFGSGFILTMAPQTIDMQSQSSTYLQFYANVKDITTVINTQYYNSGCMLGRDGKCYSQGTVDFLTALSDVALQWVSDSQLGLGLPAVPSAAGGGYVSPAVVNDALNCLATGNSCGSYKPAQKYPNIRGAMTWSINWDSTNGYNFANTVRPFLNSMP